MVTKKDNEDFENSTKFCICDNDYIHNDVKLRDHRHISGKYRGFAHRDCSINVKLNHKIHVVFTTKKIMIHILLCKKWANSILKQMSYQTD